MPPFTVFMKMVSFNMLWKLFVVVAFELSATVTSTDISQEQFKDLVESRFSVKVAEHGTESQNVLKPRETDTEGEEPPMFSVEWYLLPKPENRACLLEKLPFDMAKDVPEDCDEPIDAALEKRIRKFFSLRGLIFTSMSSYPGLETNNVDQPNKASFVSRLFGKKGEHDTKPHEIPQPINTETEENTDPEEPPRYSVEWHLLPKQENRDALRYFMPWYISISVPKDCNEPIGPYLEKRIRKYFSLNIVDWFLLPFPENRAALRKALPSDIAEDVPEDCNKRMWCGLEEYIQKFFALYAATWYMLPEPESRNALRYVLPKDLADKVPEDCNEPIETEVEKRVRKYISEAFQQQRLHYSWSYAGSS
ncbi:SmORF protein [Babesia bovis T2Bo]|nr:SmORF protein [Babesia bovis T2Bo]EDO05226.2 SmORF protein [Babesia bovis T2Bo]